MEIEARRTVRAKRAHGSARRTTTGASRRRARRRTRPSTCGPAVCGLGSPPRSAPSSWPPRMRTSARSSSSSPPAPPRERVLDLGCFNGAFSAELGRRARAARVVGVEWLPAARGRRPRPRDRGGRARPERAAAVRGRQLRSRTRKPGDRAPARDRQLPARGRARVRSGGPDRALDQQPRRRGTTSERWCSACSRFPSHVSDEVHVGNPLDPRRGLRHADIGQTHLRVFTTRALRELAAAHGLRVTATRMNGYYPLPPRAARTDGAARPAARGVHRARAGAHGAAAPAPSPSSAGGDAARS